MSGSVSADFGLLSTLIANSATVRQRFDTLTGQASSGLISNTYAGLGGTAPVALALSPQVKSLQAYQAGIDAVSGPAQVTQTAMTRMQKIGADLVANLNNLNGLSPSEIDSIAANARSSLAEVGGLLNSKYGDAYVFAGQDSANPPVPDPDRIAQSGFFTQIAAAVGDLSATTAATTLGIAGSNAAGTSPFSAYLSQPSAGLTPPTARTGDGVAEPIGLVASANTTAISAGGTTTGSYMRDLMRALATVGSLTSGQASDPNFAALVSDTRTSLDGAITAMSTDVGVLGQQQSSLQTQKTRMADTATALTGQISNAENVDMAATLSSLTQTQTQLQASYQLISTANSMSLVKYLPGG